MNFNNILKKYDTEKNIHMVKLTHKTLEDNIIDDFRLSPDYSIKNVSGYNGLELITSLFKFNEPNNLYQRSKRFMNEKLYVIEIDRMEFLMTFLVLISAIISIIIFLRSWELNASQFYQFNNSKDNLDEEKKRKLDEYNSTWNGTPILITKTLLVVIPGLITIWRIFKRTSKHREEEYIINKSSLENIKKNRRFNPASILSE